MDEHDRLINEFDLQTLELIDVLTRNGLNYSHQEAVEQAEEMLRMLIDSITPGVVDTPVGPKHLASGASLFMCANIEIKRALFAGRAGMILNILAILDEPLEMSSGAASAA
jgi:hypothetical protein